MIWKWNEHFQSLNVLLASVTFKIIPVLISEGTFCLLTAFPQCRCIPCAVFRQQS